MWPNPKFVTKIPEVIEEIWVISWIKWTAPNTPTNNAFQIYDAIDLPR